jgi:mRNA-degrading endonuclease RelE of RelBE toxin-antitoxin system
MSRNRKPLFNLAVPWQPERPVWELRVGRYRVFYDVDDQDRVVYVRAIRSKMGGRRMEDLL